MHKHSDAYDILEKIMLKVLLEYPSHAIWAMISVAKSTVDKRRKRCQDIFDKVKVRPATISLISTLTYAQSRKKLDKPSPATIKTSKLIDEGDRLVQQLLFLSNYSIKDNEQLQMDNQMKTLARCLPCSLVIPLQAALTVSLPPKSAEIATHKPFPITLPTFHRTNVLSRSDVAC